jgi:hypothetical protein
VKESLVGMAHVKRAQRRRAGGAAGDTDIPDDIAAAEEGSDSDEGNEPAAGAAAAGRGAGAGGRGGRKGAAGGDAAAPLPGGDAAPLTAFNLNEEREEGHFDEEGNFVFDKGDPEDKEDEWLRSDEGGWGARARGGGRRGELRVGRA